MGKPPEMIASFPPDGAYGHPADASLVQTRVSLVFSEALHQDSLTDASIVITDETGTLIPTTAWLFYRDMSHVIHLAPMDDLAADTWYTVSIGAGLAGIDGGHTEAGTSFQLTTTPPPPEDSGHADSGDAPDKPEAGCSGCATGSRSAQSILFALIAFVGLVRRYRPTQAAQ